MSAIRRMIVRGLSRCARVFESLSGMLALAAAGVLSRDGLVAASVNGWSKYAHGVSSRQLGLHDWEESFYKRFLRSGDRILLVGCGTGRDLIPLVEAGYEVHGLDPAPGALDVCARRLAEQGLSAVLRHGLIETITIHYDYDVVIFSWLCFGYVVGRDARHAALRTVSAALRPEGRVLLSYMAPAAQCRLGLRLARCMARVARSGWLPERGDIVVLTQTREPLALFFEHRFLPEEIEHEARDAGFVPAWHDAHGAEEASTLVLLPVTADVPAQPGH